MADVDAHLELVRQLNRCVNDPPTNLLLNEVYDGINLPAE